MTDDRILVVTTTFPSRAAAEACGRGLVDSGLVACVQVDGPVTSIYRWQGIVESVEEWRVACKTTPALEAECAATILAGHDYQTPQITFALLTAAPGYAGWVRENVRGA